MVLTDDEAFANRCRMCRNHGETSRYHHEFVGGNFRLDTMKAAILLVKLDRLSQLNAARQRNAARYAELLADTPVQTPVVRDYNTSVFHQYSILADDRDGLMAHLKECGVGSGVYYPVPLHPSGVLPAVELRGPATSQSARPPLAASCRCPSSRCWPTRTCGTRPIAFAATTRSRPTHDRRRTGRQCHPAALNLHETACARGVLGGSRLRRLARNSFIDGVLSALMRCGVS